MIHEKIQIADLRGIFWLLGAELHLGMLAWADMAPPANAAAGLFAVIFIYQAWSQFALARRWRKHNGIA